MSTILKVVGFAANVPCPIQGQYLVSFNHEAEGGLGFGTFTYDPAEAMRFDNMRHALDFYRKVPRCMPLRADGEYNRPLTATTMAFEQVVV